MNPEGFWPIDDDLHPAEDTPEELVGQERRGQERLAHEHALGVMQHFRSRIEELGNNQNIAAEFMNRVGHKMDVATFVSFEMNVHDQIESSIFVLPQVIDASITTGQLLEQLRFSLDENKDEETSSSFITASRLSANEGTYSLSNVDLSDSGAQVGINYFHYTFDMPLPQLEAYLQRLARGEAFLADTVGVDVSTNDSMWMRVGSGEHATLSYKSRTGQTQSLNSPLVSDIRHYFTDYDTPAMGQE